MSKFSFVVNDDGTSTVTVNGEVLPDVRAIFVHGTPHDYSVAVEQFVRNEHGNLYVDESTCEIASKTAWFWFN